MMAGKARLLADVIEKALNSDEATQENSTLKEQMLAFKEILDAAGSKFNMHNPATWPKQAKLAAAAKWEELDLLQQQLKVGK